MKIFHTLILCLCTLSVYSQSSKANKTDGTYLFEKAVFTISNSNSKSEVDTRIITDPALVDTTDMFLQNIFLQATISNGILSFCVLPDQSEYTVEDGIILLPTKEKSEVSLKHSQRQLSPYSSSFSDNRLTFTFIFLYGDSNYDFPLEGKLTITLTKQKYG